MLKKNYQNIFTNVLILIYLMKFNPQFLIKLLIQMKIHTQINSKYCEGLHESVGPFCLDMQYGNTVL